MSRIEKRDEKKGSGAAPRQSEKGGGRFLIRFNPENEQKSEVRE